MTVFEIIKDATNPKMAMQIKENVKKHNIDRTTNEVCKTDFEDIFDCIAHGFVWDQTPQGFEYWANIADMYNTFKKKIRSM